MKHCRFSTGLLSAGLFLLLTCLLFGTAAAQSAKETPRILFQKGNTAYSQGKYDQAIGLYEQILSQKGSSQFLLYNLANSYAQTGRTGRAILNYERALLLSHGNSDIRGNLELVRKNQGLFQEEPSVGTRFIQFLGLNQWALLGLSCLLLTTLVHVGSIRFSLGRQLKFWLSGSLMVLFFLSFFAAFSHYRQWHSAVVVEPDMRLLLSPFSSASSTGTIQEGRIVMPGKKHDDFFLVEDETGRSGWLPASAIEFITKPRPSLDGQ